MLGGNEGDRRGYLLQAARRLQCRAGAIVRASQIYRSEAWGFAADTDFLNQALLVETGLPPLALLNAALAIETLLGRVRTGKAGYAPRPIDIDILLYDCQIVSTPELEIPHPRLHLRRFALMPLTEIAPEWMHPVFNKTIQTLLRQCPDSAQVSVWRN